MKYIIKYIVNKFFRKKKYVTWSEAIIFIKNVDEAFKDKQFDCVYAIARGGAVLGTLFSYYQNIPIRYACLSSYNGENKETEPLFKQHAPIAEFKNILVIDDIIDTGETINMIKNTIVANSETKQFTFATMYATPQHKFDVDYYQEIKDNHNWIIFPWEIEKENLKDK